MKKEQVEEKKNQGDYITTYGGSHFYPTDPNMESFYIKDTAHALSMICRGNGHVKTFLSVGQHCIGCALEARARGYSKRLQLACLLHDAGEAYMSDVPRPFKKYLKDYIAFEDRLLALIYEKYLGSALTEEENTLVKAVDNDLLAWDLFFLLGEGDGNALPEVHVEMNYGKWSFGEVENKYLELFEELTALPEKQKSD